MVMIMTAWQTALDQLMNGDLRQWSGLPSPGPLTIVRQYFANHTNDIGLARLGEASYRFLVIQHQERLRAWFVPETNYVVLLDMAYPELQPNLSTTLAALGKPKAKLDTYFGTLPIPQGEWIYPERGLVLFLNEAANTIFHLAVMAPTTLTQYQTQLRLSLRKRRRTR